MKKSTSLFLAMMLTLSLGACGTTNAPSSSVPSASVPSVSTAAPKEVIPEGQTLTVYLNDFDAVIGELFKEATGHDLEIVSGNGAEIMSRIAAEKGNPQWDVVWADMMPSIYGLMQNGEVITDWAPANAANLSDFTAAIVPEEKGYFPTGAHAAGVLVYRNDVFDKTTAPSDIFDLASGNYKLGMADPGVAAPAYPLAAYFMDELGLEKGKEYFSKLFDAGLKVYPKNPQVVQALASGEINVALLQESNAYDMLNSGEPITIVWPENGAPASVRVAAISASTEKEALAKEFVNFLLDPQVQQKLVDLGDEGFFEPSAKGAKMNETRVQGNATLAYADAKWACDNEAEIKSWFADMSAK